MEYSTTDDVKGSENQKTTVVFIMFFLFGFDCDEGSPFEMHDEIGNLLCLIYLEDVPKNVTGMTLQRKKIKNFSPVFRISAETKAIKNTGLGVRGSVGE